MSKKQISRQARTESGENAERAEGEEVGKGLVAVVGIGASAGGFEAFKQLLARLPVDTGMAFVLVTHLDPRHESILPELLARATQMPVSEVEDGTPVAPDHVYVMPRSASLTIEGGALRLRPREEGRVLRHPIDAFLQTLAEDQRARAIGVILSGTATDGTLGLEAVKAEGGITFAQDPKSAKYDSMPRSAVAAGCVDFVLRPEGIAEELARISRHPYVAPAEIAEPGAEETAQPADKNGFNKILALLRRATGVDFSLYKTNTLRRRIRRRMVLNKLDGLDDYAKYLREHAAELENLYQDILINVTSFFRNPEAFEVLKEKIFPRIVEHRAPDEPVRIWVVGCSTGEEAYSVAMAFTEFAGDRSDHIPVQIFATDLNQRGIERARAGLYPKNIAEDVSPERLRRFFTEAEGGYRISKPLRDMCVFARQNIIADPPFSRMDLISCRNLLIYLEPVLQKQILPLLHYALKATGVLWLGSSETTGAASDLFEPEDKKNRFYTRKPATRQPRFNYPTGDQTWEKSNNRRQPAARAERAVTSGETEAQREAERIILARYAPASALISEEMNILQLRGDIAPYLDQSPEKTTRNLLKLARDGLLVALREAVAKARNDESPVRKENLRVKYEDATGDVNIEVIPLKHSGSQERYFLTLFETRRGRRPKRRAAGGRQEAEIGGTADQAIEPGIGHHARLPAIGDRRIRSDQRGAPVRQRGGPVRERGVAKHQRRAGDLERRAGIVQRRVDHAQRGIEQPERGVGTAQQRSRQSARQRPDAHPDAGRPAPHPSLHSGGGKAAEPDLDRRGAFHRRSQAQSRLPRPGAPDHGGDRYRQRQRSRDAGQRGALALAARPPLQDSRQQN